ncbi:EAL domain-containing protein [Burkholderia sp. L27(2015)]|uniref:EAL domain-containing protein n=1 Tax=Burkholderia sp. L27(2015) TaxID=1641858 RepID=UPI00131EB233|nr:EAL domain-containing protein [Burkholderia sp. L27(2015)]
MTRRSQETSHSRFRMLYEALPAISHSIDAQGRLVLVSDVWLSTLGYERSEVVGRFWPDFLTPASRAYATEVIIPELFRTGRCKDIEYQMVRKDGVLIDILLSSFIERDASGAPLQSLTVIQDVTQRKREQSELAVQYERLRVTLDSIGDGVITTDAQGRIEYLNPVAERLTGWTNAQARSRPSAPVFNIVHEETRRRAMSPISVCLAEDRIVGLANHTILLSRDCREYHIEDSAAPIKDATGRTVGVVLVFRDVSEQRQLSLEMTYRATHDELTGLLNRSEFERRLESTLMAAHKVKDRYVLMYIDLDRFKLVNDAGGHAVGDRLLKQVAGLIKKVARRHDIFARLGGDEFGLIVEHCSIEAAQSIAQKICEEIDEFRFQHGEQLLHIGASIGLVQIDERWPTVASLLRAADSACYAAKEAGRNRVYAYFAADEVIDSHQKDMQWVRRLEHALDNGQFVLHWQEVKAMGSVEEGLHAEVLLRLVGENRKLISPGAFLPSAERFYMASRIDRWVVNEAFEWMARHRDALGHLDTLSINLSGLSIGDGDFHRYVIDLIETMAFDHHKLCFEITETAAITNLSDATSFFESMHAFGIRFALDDFGSGLSSFSYLKNLPADYLKIDGQFIRDLATNLVGQATVRCIQEVARITGKKTVAEFVETEAVEALLREIGVDYTQGFLRHRPEPLDTILTMRSPARSLSE